MNKKPHLNTFMFFCLPTLLMLLKVSFLVYVILFFYILKNKKNLLPFFAHLLLILCISYLWDIHKYDKKLMVNAINETLGLSWLFFLPIYKINIPLSASKFHLFFILCFPFIGYFISSFNGVEYEKILQISVFSFVLIIPLFNSIRSKIVIFIISLAASARSILLGFTIGFFGRYIVKFKRSASIFIISVFTYVVYQFDIITIFMDYLNNLKSDGVHLKGRISFWLEILSNTFSFFGQGPGKSVELISNYLGKYQLPHNEYLRILMDYGYIVFSFTLINLYRISIRNKFTYLATSVFGSYMFFGNPLTFPTVIVSFVVFIKFYYE